MADTRVEMDPGWDSELREAIAAGLHLLFADDLGPAILADARRGCPIDTGRLEKSLDAEVRRDGDALPYLIVGSFPDADGPVEYAAATEYGFKGLELVEAFVRKDGTAVRAHLRKGNTPEQPFLRPAVFKKRAP